MTIRPYQPTDHLPLLAVFHKSVPHAFSPEEATDFAHFLRTNTDPSFVAELTGQVVGSCGQLQHTQPDFWAPDLDLYFVSKPNEPATHP